MDPRVEEILMARAMQDAADKPTPLEAIAAGGGAGSIAGILAGRGGKGLGIQRRMAGGLVGLILGGGLGAGTRQLMIDNSPTAKLLAKGQVEGFTESDMDYLKEIIGDTYAQMGLR